MASQSGASSGSSSLQTSCDEPLLADQRKRKRMISNRESARRSRMRKQKHLDDLTNQLSQLRSENNQIISNISVVNQLNLNVESENSVLKVQISELNHRLRALNEITSSINANNFVMEGGYGNNYDQMMIGGDGDYFNSWNLIHGVNQPIMGCSDHAFMY